MLFLSPLSHGDLSETHLVGGRPDIVRAAPMVGFGSPAGDGCPERLRGPSGLQSPALGWDRTGAWAHSPADMAAGAERAQTQDRCRLLEGGESVLSSPTPLHPGP